MLSKEASKKYNIYKSGYHGIALEISREDWQRMVDDHPSQNTCQKKTGASQGWLEIKANKYGVKWVQSYVPVDRRPDGLYGTLKYQELRQQQTKIEAQFANYTGPIYAIACLHSVFADLDRLMAFLEREKEGLRNGTLLIVGDIFDFYNLSLFKKEYHDIRVKDEIYCVKQLLAIIKTYCKKIILVPGNHDNRAVKRLAEQVQPEVRAAMSMMGEGLDHYCKRAGLKSDDIDNLKMLATGSVLSYLAEVSGTQDMKLWHCRIGDIIFCHPEKGVSIPMGTAVRGYMHFSVREQGAGAVVVFHTHKVGCGTYRKWFIAEGGCMARLMDYQTSPILSPGGADLPYVGYLKGQMKDGKLDKTTAATYCLGECR